MTDEPGSELTAAFDPSEIQRTDSPTTPLAESIRRAPTLLPKSQGGTLHAEPAIGDDLATQTWNNLDSGEAPKLEFLDELATGGMGAVLRARDPALNREVAVKVLLERLRSRPELVRRFIEEAQIGGQLQHPGVVPVYGVGTFADRRPYFTMKLVKGRTLLQLLKARSDLVSERPKFLKIFEQICQTLAYAHSKNVIHRDLKPGNVMIGNFGEVQVMDWGLAKVLDEVGAPKPAESLESRASLIRTVRTSPTGTAELVGPDTQTGSVLGTIGYMPPEQAVGDVENLDARADVFGLGAILCEILTGRPPYVADTPMQTLQLALRCDLRAAFAALDGCGVDAELIVLVKKCLEVEPRDRFRDAGELAMELTGYLDSVETRLRLEQLARIEAQAKAAEESNRRRMQLLYASMAMAVLLLGIGGTCWGLVRARSAQAAAELAESREREQREQTVAERDKAIEAERDTKAFSDFLVNQVLATARPKGMRNGLGFDITMSKALAAAELKIDDVFDGQPRAEATARHALGDTWRDLGDYPAAEKQLRQAVALRTKLFGAEDERTLQAQMSLAATLLQSGRVPLSIEILENVRAAFRDKYPQEHTAHIQVLNDLAINYRKLGRNKEAIKLYQEVREIQEKALTANDPEALKTLSNLAHAYAADKRIDEAIELFEQVRAELAIQLGPDDAPTLTATNNLALAYRTAGKLPLAIGLMEKVRDGRIKTLDKEHPLTLTTLHSLGHMYIEAGRKIEGFRTLEGVRNSRVRKLGIGEAITQATLKDLAVKYHAAGMADKALEVIRDLHSLLLKERGPQHIETAIAKSLLGEALMDMKQFAEAERFLLDGLESIKASNQQLPSDTRKKEVVAAIDRLIRLADAINRPDQAVKWRKMKQLELESK